MKLIIAGSRGITDIESTLRIIENAVDFKKLVIDEVVSGCAKGVDTIGELFAIKRFIPIKRFPADWDRYGKSAGYRRNEEMANYADGLLAIWDGQSKGTGHMINIVNEKNLETLIIRIGKGIESGQQRKS